MLSLLALSAYLTADATQAASPQPSERMVRIFISPAGEPFRDSGPDYPSKIWFDRADTNRDGHLTAAEMMIQARSFFNRLDLNKNGVIDGEEIRNYEDNVAPEIRVLVEPAAPGPVNSESTGKTENGMPDPNRGPDRKVDVPRGAGRFSFFNVAEPVMRADTDLSRSVSTDEFDAWQQKQFNALDAQHRGYLMFADLPDTPAQGTRIRVRTRSR